MRADRSIRRYHSWFSYIGRWTLLLLIPACGPLPTAWCQTAKATTNTSSTPSPRSLEDPKEYASVVERLLQDQKFDELDRMIDADRAGKTRFPGGGWKLYGAYGVLGRPQIADGSDVDDPAWQAHLDVLKRWIAAKPDSITARVALAEAYVSYAWFARGDETADLVEEESWKLFNQRLQMARDTLERAFALPTKCPQWYDAMQDVALGQSWDLIQREKLLEQASQFEPLYYYYYQNHAYALQPKWHGKPGDSEEFAEQIASRIGGKQGDIIYFETLASIRFESHPSHVSWQRLQHGFAAEEELYGTSNYKLNAFAELAARAENSEVALPLFLRIGKNWCREVWRSRSAFEAARNWAFQPPDDSFFKAWSAANSHFQVEKDVPYVNQVLADFHKSYDEEVKQCTAASKYDEGRFTMCVRVSKLGAVEQLIPWPPTSVSRCLAQKLAKHRFAAPPEPSFWVAFNIGEFKPESVHYSRDWLPDPGK